MVLVGVGVGDQEGQEGQEDKKPFLPMDRRRWPTLVRAQRWLTSVSL